MTVNHADWLAGLMNLDQVDQEPEVQWVTRVGEDTLVTRVDGTTILFKAGESIPVEALDLPRRPATAKPRRDFAPGISLLDLERQRDYRHTGPKPAATPERTTYNVSLSLQPDDEGETLCYEFGDVAPETALRILSEVWDLSLEDQP